MLSNLFGRALNTTEKLTSHRKDGLVRQIDFLLDTLENNQFDILYMENLKNPLTPDERMYFIQQIDRIQSAKTILMWMRTNIINNTPFWKRFLRW